MKQQSNTNDSLVLSYLDLRKAIGVIGMSLPFVLAIGKLILDGSGLEGSMSAYYYTVMRDIFVGSLFATAVFLMSYRGYERTDDLAAKLAALLVLGTALFPTSPKPSPNDLQIQIGYFHILFALGFYLTLAFFSLALFRKTNPNKKPTPQKIIRNRIYTVCGYGILACIILIVVYGFLPKSSSLVSLKLVFWLEALANLFFGISWFVKGEAILKDE